MPNPERFGGMPPDEIEKPASPAAETSDAAKEMEDVEKFLDASFEELCERYLTKFNEGNNGIILRMKIEDIPADLISALRAKNIDLSDEKVAKILKVYAAGKGLKEFQMQSKAYDLLAQHADDPKYAKVPKPYFHRDFPVGEGAKQRLSSLTDRAFSGDRAEMFMMDFVPGDDVATILYKEVATRHPKTADLANRLDDIGFEELQERVAQALDYRVPGGKARDEGERDFERRKVFSENAEKLMAYLDRRGFHMNPAIVEQIDNTMKLFHANGLAFRDGHHRNFMVVGDVAMPADGSEPKNPPQVYIIDFGASETTQDPKKIADLFKEVDGNEGEGAVVRNYPSDFAVANELRRFTAPPDKRMGEEERRALEDIRKRRSVVSSHPRLKGPFEALMGSARDGAPRFEAAYNAVVGVGMPNEGGVENFLAMVAAAVQDNPGTAEAAKAYLATLIAKKLPPPVHNRIARFLKTL